MITSGGVTSAASTKMPTMAYLRTFFRPAADTSPALPISVSRTGSWKQMPKAMMNFSDRSSDSRTEPRNTVRNSSFAGVSTTGATSSPAIRLASAGTASENPIKKFIANGVTTRCAKAAPARNSSGEAMTKGRNAFFSDL